MGAATLWRDVQAVVPDLVPDLVHSQHDPKVPASTNRLEGWFGHFKPRARLTRGLKTEARALNFAGRWSGAWTKPRTEPRRQGGCR